MDGERLRGVAENLRKALAPDAGTAPSDADLLRRWMEDRDQAAFELLVYRHGPMVLATCRRVLRDAHEAEDATQAAFLALARKAGSIARREAVAGWLYRVAYRAALQARDRLARRPAQAERALQAATVVPSDDLVWRDLRPVLDGEVARLPTKLRVAFVLCHLEGRSNEEAAGELRCPVGTVLSRLARARERLRFRLSRRGLALSAGAVAAASAHAVTPAALAASTVRAAMLFVSEGAGAAGLSPDVACLAQGLLRDMTMTKLRTMAAVLLAVLGAGVGTGVAFGLKAVEQPGAAERPKEAAGQRAQAEGAEAALKKALVEEARKVYEQDVRQLKVAFDIAAEDVYRWSRRWLEAQMDLAVNKEERMAALRDHLGRMKDLEKVMTAAARAGQRREADAAAGRYYRAQAELWLARAK
jgi:RNA polymerase sigma factor (sigma-70 family)